MLWIKVADAYIQQSRCGGDGGIWPQVVVITQLFVFWSFALQFAAARNYIDNQRNVDVCAEQAEYRTQHGTRIRGDAKTDTDLCGIGCSAWAPDGNRRRFDDCSPQLYAA